MGRKAIFAVLLVGVLLSLFVIVFVSANSNVDFVADVYAPRTSIQITNSIYMGNISKGYSTDKTRVDINNTGDVAVKVTPQLSNSSEEIFSNLYFARRTTEPYGKIGNFSLNISQPSSLGDVTDEYFYVKLDLTGYTGTISADKLGHKAQVVFYALPL